MKFIESDNEARIERNLKIILETVKNSCPMMRDFGLSNTFIDNPTQKVKATLNAEIIENCRKYLPEIEIKSIDYEVENNTLKPKINYRIK